MSEARTGDDAELAMAWTTLHETSGQARSDSTLFWAWEALDEICRRDPERCLAIIAEIVGRSASDIVLANVAAGPLEDLLVRHGQQIVDRVVARARTDPRWRKLLGGVWQNAMDDAVWAKIQLVATPRW